MTHDMDNRVSLQRFSKSFEQCDTKKSSYNQRTISYIETG